MDRGTNLLLLGIGLYLIYELSQQPAAAAGRPTGSGASGGMGAGGGTGSGGSGGGPVYSPGSPQPAGTAGGQPYGPPNPLTDPCNMAGSAWDQIGCTNAGGQPYWDNGNGISSQITSPTSPASTNYQDSGDPCDVSSVQYNPEVCGEMGGSVYDSTQNGSTTNLGGGGAGSPGNFSGDGSADFEAV